MDAFSISQLAQYAGLKPHTIRMWEQRYGALQPQRSGGNTRFYNNEQLRRLLNIVSLLPTGHKVSELCLMPDKELFARIINLQSNGDPENVAGLFYTPQLTAAALAFDEAAFDKLFSHCVLRHGLTTTITQIIYPLLERIGLMWAGNMLPPAQEHFVSNLVRQKLSTAIDGLPAANKTSKKWLLFLPEDELHDIGLLLAHYLIRQAGETSFLLGANLPISALESAIAQIHPTNLLLFFVHNNLPENILPYVKHLEKKCGQSKIFITGRPNLLQTIPASKKTILLHNVQELEQQLQA